MINGFNGFHRPKKENKLIDYISGHYYGTGSFFSTTDSFSGMGHCFVKRVAISMGVSIPQVENFP